jgi:DMSO reductase anchor subunit
VKTYLIVFTLFAAAVVGGFFYVAYKDIHIEQKEVTKSIPMPTDISQ